MLVPRTIRLLSLLGLLLSEIFGFSPRLVAQTETPAGYGQQPSLVIRHTRPLWAADENVAGRLEKEHNLRRMVLVLAPSLDQEAELQKLVEDQHAKLSPKYHRWLSAAEFGQQFGATEVSIEQARKWLEGSGLHVDAIAAGRRWLEFSGTVSQVEAAFHTTIQYYRVGGQLHIANSTDIAIPASLSGITRGVFSLNDFGKQLPVHPKKTTHPELLNRSLAPHLTAAGSGNTYYVAPGDFATIYGTKSLLSAGVDGSGVTIAAAAQSQIELTDVQQFRQIFGLKTNDPNIILTGPDPGISSQLDAEEALLDVEWAGAVAPGATIDLIVAGSTDTTSGVDLAAAYAIDQEIAPILTYTYGACEQALGPAGNAFYNALWQQAAAEGITVLVAAGDNGAAGCDDPTAGAPAQLGPAVNGVASTPYNVAVGGTEFDDGLQPTTYWNTTNASDYSSALGYIPERGWNESCDPSQTASSTNCAFGGTNVTLLAGSGGASTVYPKPSWQSGNGVPADGARDLPDLALAAASAHDDFVYCTSLGGTPCQINAQQQVVGLTLVGGTSAATPALAGILALIEQKNGPYQGQINHVLYNLAATPASVCDSSQQTNPTAQTSCVFYDVTLGNNSVSCAGGSLGCSSTVAGTNGVLGGNNAGPGYDLVTGLGSINVTNLASAWPSALHAPSSVILQASALNVTHGTPIMLSGSVTSSDASGIPTGLVAIKTDGFGDSAQTLTLSTSGTFTGAVSDLPGGQYNVLAHYAGDGTFGQGDSAVLPVTITPEDSTTNLAPIGLTAGSVGYGASVPLKVTVAGVSGQGIATGAVQIQDNNSTVITTSLGPDGIAYIPTGGGAAYSFTPGMHSLAALYSGDSSFHASTSATIALTINKGTPFVVVGVNSPTVSAGGTVGVHAIVSSLGTIAATGMVQFTSDGNPLGAPVPLQTSGFFGPQAQANTLVSGLPPGAHVIGATYLPATDPNFVGVTTGDPVNELTQTVTVGDTSGAATITKLAVGPTPMNLGDTGTFVVTLMPRTATGTVTIWDAVGPRSVASPINSGMANIQFAWTQAGTASVYAVYSGDATNASSSSAATTFTVQRGSPAVALSAPATAFANQQVTFNVKVSANPANPNLPFPTGTVEFWDSLNGAPAQLLAMQPLTAGPTATSVYGVRFPFAPGAHTIYAHYRGDTNWQPRDSATVTLDASTFALNVTPGSIPVLAGSSGSGTVTITPSGGFTGTVALACATGASTLPVGYSCAFAEPNVTISSGAATTTITLSPNPPPSSAIKAANSGARRQLMSRWTLAVGVVFLAVYGIAFPLKNGRNFAAFIGLVALVASFVYGCGGGGGGGGGGGPVSTTTNLVSSNAKAGFGVPVTLTATVTPSGAATPTGSMQLFDNGQALGSPVRVNAGIATFLATSLPVGVHTLKAQYLGDSNTLSSTSAPISQAVTGQVIVEITGASNGIVQTTDFSVLVN